MRVAVIGRTRWLIDSARALVRNGHEIGFVATSKAADYDTVGPDDFAALAGECGCAFVRTATLDTLPALDLLRQSRCDIAVSINWNSILGEPSIASLPGGILNVHAGDLPRYRGNAVVNWAIINGERHIGLCLHRMEPGVVDAGEIIARTRLEIDAETYVGDVYRWLDTAIPQLVVEGIGAAGARPGPPESYEAAARGQPGLRCYPRRPSDSRVDWTQTVDRIHRLVRASAEPFSGAFTSLEGDQVVRIWRAEIVIPPEPLLAMPGQVMERDGGMPVVACGEGALRLSRVTIDGLDDGDRALRLIARSLRSRLI